MEISINTLKRIIVQGQERLSKLELVPRIVNIEEAGNYIITGSRRAGKTYYLYQLARQYANECKQFEQILYINFEDERLIEFDTSDFENILVAYKELFPNIAPRLYLDEIQDIPFWDKYARRLADEGYRVYITGSNARMLSKEMATVLGGRYIIKEIYPLSFREYLDFNHFKLKPNFEFGSDIYALKQLFNEYFYHGGFPEILNFKDKADYLSNLFQKLFYSDIIVRNKVKNDMVLKLLIKKLAESLTNDTSFNRIKNLIKSIGYNVGTNTLIEYCEHLKDAYLMFSISNHLSPFVERETSKKHYFIDNGVLNLFVPDQPSKLMENMVFLHLYKKYGTDLFFLKKNIEVDFYIPSKKLLFQVSYEMSDNETKKREVKALVKAMNYIDAEVAYIITYDEEETIRINDKTIQVLPVWKWMLGE